MEQGLEVTLLGFGGGQSSFRGQLETREGDRVLRKGDAVTGLEAHCRRHLPRRNANLCQRQ